MAKKSPNQSKTQKKKVESVKAKEKRTIAKASKPIEKSKNLIQKNTKERKPSNTSKEENNSIIENEEPEDYEAFLKKYESSKTEVKEKLIPKLDDAQMKQAIEVISNVIKEKYSSNVNVLADEQEEMLYVNFMFDKLPERYSIRPLKIKLPNSIYSEKFSTSICIFVKDPKSSFKELQMEFPFNVKVIDVSKLKIKYERFEDRRNLLKQHSLFLCDNRIYFLLRKLLGKTFYAANKFPIPVKIDYENKEETQKEIISYVQECSHFYMKGGPSYNVKFSREIMSKKEKFQNLHEAILNTVPHIIKYGISLEELKMISIKGNNTIELPIYNHLKDEEINNFLEAK